MQKTLRTAFSLHGTGLHSGAKARLRVLPAAAEFGIWFRRVDITDRDNLIPALFDYVSETTLCTKLSNEAGVAVATVEHLMAAFSGTGINNAIVEVDGPEVPIMDGSSAPFVTAILNAGIVTQGAPVRAIRVLKEVKVSVDDIEVSLTPSETLEIDFAIEYDQEAIGQQSKQLNLANGTFVRELSDCRTFCRRRDVEMMQAQGLAQGGSLDNAVVVDGASVLNPEGFRRTDECVRHKMLDALGDLSLAGCPLIGAYRGRRAGHRATNLLLKELFADSSAWEMIVCDQAMADRLPGAHLQPEDLART